jgi:hypothetical protein
MSYKDEIERARRLAILMTLHFADGYTLPARALRTQVEATGYITSADKLMQEVAWLGEMGYVEQLELDAVRLTERGADIATGRSTAPGVRRPDPGELNGPR